MGNPCKPPLAFTSAWCLMSSLTIFSNPPAAAADNALPNFPLAGRTLTAAPCCNNSFTISKDPAAQAACSAVPYSPDMGSVMVISAPAFNKTRTLSISSAHAAACNGVPYGPPTALTFAPASSRTSQQSSSPSALGTD